MLEKILFYLCSFRKIIENLVLKIVYKQLTSILERWKILRGITVQHLRRSRVVNAAKRQPFPTSKSHGVVSEKPLGFHLKSP